MIKIEFTAEEIQALDYERYHHPHPRVQRKMEALWLKSQKLPHRQIGRLTGISAKTLQRYLSAYQEGGIERLKEVNFYQPQSALQSHAASIETYFREHPPASIKEAMAKIEEQTGIKRSEKRVRKFLISLGIKRRKVGMIPAKADSQKQESFKKKNWNLDSKKLNLIKGSSTLWMPLILSWLPSWDLFGHSPDSSSKPPLEENALMFWAPSMPSLMN